MSTFFADAQGRYRYWFKQGPQGVSIKVQMRREMMRNFRAGAGRKSEALVDILECGGGWYSITSKDLIWNELYGTHTDGAKLWIADLNLHFLHDINANRYRFAVERVAKIDFSRIDSNKLAALQGKFSRNRNQRSMSW